MCYKVRRFLITSCTCAWPIILGQANPSAKDNGTAVGRSVVDLPLDYHSSELPDSPGKDKSIQLASKAPSSLLAQEKDKPINCTAVGRSASTGTYVGWRESPDVQPR